MDLFWNGVSLPDCVSIQFRRNTIRLTGFALLGMLIVVICDNEFNRRRQYAYQLKN